MTEANNNVDWYIYYTAFFEIIKYTFLYLWSKTKAN